MASGAARAPAGERRSEPVASERAAQAATCTGRDTGSAAQISAEKLRRPGRLPVEMKDGKHATASHHLWR